MSDQTHARNPWEYAVAALALAVVFVIAISPITTFDLFWHLSAGRVQVEEGGVLSKELFSHTRAGADWHNHSWLAASLFYVVCDLGGLAAVTVLKAAIVVATMLFLLLALRVRGVSCLLSAPLLVWAALVAITRLTERPHLFTMLFLAVFIYLLTRYVAGQARARSLLLVPALGALWANLHSGSIFGLAVVGAYFAGEVLQRLAKVRSVGALACVWREPRARNLGLACLAFIAAQGATPYGYGSLAWLLGYFEPREAAADFLRVNAEFMAPTFANSAPLFLSLGLLLVVVVAGWRKLAIAEVIMVVPFVASALAFQRMVGELAIVMVPVLASGLVGALRWRRVRLGFAAVAGVAVLAYSLQVKVLASDGPHRLGFGVESRVLPVGAAEFLADSQFEGNIYNSDSFGGYLAWKLYPQVRIFFDGRGFVFAGLYEELHRGGLTERYGITAAVVRQGDVEAQLLFPVTQWEPVFADQTAVILVKRGHVTRAMKEAGLRGVMRALAERPDDADLLFSAGMHQFDLGARSAAAPYLERVVALGKHLPPAHTTLGYIAYDASRWAVAEGHFRAAIAADPAFDSPWYGLGLSLEAQARTGEAAAAYVKYLSLSQDERWRAEARKRLDALKR